MLAHLQSTASFNDRFWSQLLQVLFLFELCGLTSNFGLSISGHRAGASVIPPSSSAGIPHLLGIPWEYCKPCCQPPLLWENLLIPDLCWLLQNTKLFKKIIMKCWPFFFVKKIIYFIAAHFRHLLSIDKAPSLTDDV